MNHAIRNTQYAIRNTYHTSRITHHVSRITFHVLALACVLGLLARLALPVAAQNDISFTASVDKSSFSSDELVTLQLTLSGTFSGAGEPQFPALTGLVILGSSRSSQVSIVNGQVSSRMVFTYRLQPTQLGDLTIPPISIKVGQQTYQTQPVTLHVSQGAAPTAAQPTAEAPADVVTPSTLSGQSLYVEADVDNPTPVVGQQIIYRFRLYQAVNLFNQPRLDWPDFTGFLTYDLSPNKQYYQDVEGRQYLVTEVRRALFATAPGVVEIASAELTIPGDFFNKTLRLQTGQVSLDVHPLPQGVPEGFTGAVGQFEIEAWVEPAETRVNEPVTLFVQVSGAGNLSALPDPTEVGEDAEAILPGWRVYDPQVSTNVNQEGDVIRGEKRFERPLVPKTDGELTIPGFALVYFDPVAGEYRRVETTPLVVRVTPGEAAAPGPVVIGDNKQDVLVLGSDIRHIKPAPPTLMLEGAPLLSQPLYWAGWGIPLLTVVATWAWERRRQSLESNVAYARAQRAGRLARKRLAEAHKLVKTDEDAVYAAVAHTLTGYLGNKLNLPSAGLTRDAIQQALTTRAVPDETATHLLLCLDWADSGRFAPVAAGREAGELVKEAEEIITGLEQAIR